MNVCPNCKNNKNVELEISSVDSYACFHIRWIGRITLLICADCGTVFLESKNLNKVKELVQKRGNE